MKPFVLSLERMREIFAAESPQPSDAELQDRAKRLSEIAYVTLEVLAAKRAAPR